MAISDSVARFIERVDADYVKRTPGSARIDRRAVQVCPGGDYRSTVWHAPYPTVMARGEGCHLEDVDGNRYLDLCGNFTSMVLGNDPPEITRAIARACEQQGLAMAAPTESVYQWAQMICDRVPSVERVRFCCSGSEAAMFPIRVARAFTGRPKFVRMEGGFHGHFDELYQQLGWPGVPRGFTNSALDEVLLAPFNDAEAMDKILAEHPNQVAAVIVEPVMGAGGMIAARDGYLRQLREITSRHGALLIFDEVITFRLTTGGAQQLFEVEPDLTAFGKSVGGGMPAAAFGGREDVMAVFSQRDQEDALYQAGTFMATPACAAAGMASLAGMTSAALDHINGLGDRVAQGLERVIAELGVRARVSGIGSLRQLFWVADAPRRPEDTIDQPVVLQRMFHKLMLERGFFVTPRGLFVQSVPMTEADVDASVEAARDSIETLLPIIEEVAPHLMASDRT
jgi:glutamate-1-semialdehyde 2,1-aminomutase